jgi:hypothetical protein
MDPGTYVISETGPDGYTQKFTGGQVLIITITPQPSL